MAFSPKQADIACNFFQKILKHTADDWFGKPFELSPWQEEAIREIWGQLDDEDRRVIQMAYLEVPKKAGKTEFAAGIVLMALLLDPNPGCQVYGAAASQKQAGNVYRAACKMVEQSPLLGRDLRILRGTNRIIKRRDPESFYAAIAADGDLSDGVNPSVVVADEVHRWRERKHLENWDVLSLGGITRRQALTIAITTAGVQSESPLAWRLHEKTERIRQKIVEDRTFFGRIYGAGKDDDWTAESTWKKANPSLKDNGGFLDISKIREKYEASLSDPASQTSFRRYYLNIWDQKENRVIPMDKWDTCPMDWRAQGLLKKAPEDKVRPLPSELLKHFIERRCWAGVDASMTTDLSAVVFLFDRPDGSFDLLPFFYMPEDAVKMLEKRDLMPYSLWAEQGFIEVHDGSVIDLRELQARLEWGWGMFDFQEACFDPWNTAQISVPLAEIFGADRVIDVPQGMAHTSEPNKKFLSLVASRQIHHGGHPVMRHHASCVSSKEINDNLLFVKPERQKSSSRIDGITAARNALKRGMIPQSQSSGRLMEII